MFALAALGRSLLGLLRHRTTWIVLAIAAVVGTVWWFWHQAQEERARRVVAELERDGVKHLNDSTQARLAAEELLKTQYQDQLAAAKQLNGHLIAALRIRVPARDTVIQHDTLPTGVRPDSTREARFRDSTFAGVLEGTVTAPPYPAPLGLSYQLHRPAFDPSVGFSRVADRCVATVSWAGEHYDIQAPYCAPPARPLDRFQGFAGGGLEWGDDRVPYGQLGLVLTPWRGFEVRVYGEARREPAAWRGGLRAEGQVRF